MDKFLVDLDSVLDKLEAEDADRCASDKLSEDEACNLVGSSVYRNSDSDKIRLVVGADGGGGSGVSHVSHHSFLSSHPSTESNYAKSSGTVTGKSNVIPDGGSTSNSNHGRCELDSFFSSPHPVSKTSMTPEDSVGSKNSVLVSQMEASHRTFNSKSSVTEAQVNNLLVNECRDEPNLSSAISDIGGGILDSDGGFKGSRDSSQSSNHEKQFIKPLASYQDDSIQQTRNLEPNYNNTIIFKDINEVVNQESDYRELEKADCVTTPSTNIIQSEGQSIGDQVTSSSSFGELLLSNLSSLPSSSSTQEPPSSLILPESNILLSEPKGDCRLKEEGESVSDEEMTEEEVKALEKELESELERLNNQSQVSTLEDLIEAESKSLNLIPTEPTVASFVTNSPPLSSLASSSTTTTTTTTSSSSSSSLLTTLSNNKPIEKSIASDVSLLDNQPSESHQSSSMNQNESNLNESNLIDTNEEASMMVNKEAENTSVVSDNDANTSMVTTKPVRPATLPLTNNQQSNQFGLTPMHGDDDEFIPNPSPIIPPPETETEAETETSSQFSGPDNERENVSSSIGYFKPFWIPDEDASQCMICDVKFTVMKRRHHCRACGKVLCAQCSRFKAPLAYLSFEKARVCDQCLPLLTEGGNISGQDNSFNDSRYYQQHHPLGAEGLPTPSAPPPNQLSGTSSLITGSTAQSSGPSSSSIQPVSVLRRSSKPRTGEPKQVIFSDGIRPGNDLKDDQVTSVSHRRHAKKVKSPPVEKNPTSPGFSSSSSKSRLSQRIVIHDANGQLPPIINGSSSLHSDPTFDNLLTLLEKEDEPPVTFSLTKNLMALVKLVKLDCCTNEHCWSFTSQNLSTVGQDEIIVVVEKTPEENVLPRDIFRLFAYIFDSASKGYPFSELSHVLYPDGFFGLKDFPSFVFIRPTFQCLNKLILPPSPFLIGVLIHRFEVPWAKLFPLRLVLRLGSKYHCYPCPITSYRSRRPSYFEIGHTVMDILADFRNFQYTLPVIPGLTIHTEAKRTTVTFPKNRYDKVMKALGSSNEYVLSFGGTFSLTADSHLTCIQNDDGQYHTQTIRLNEDENSEPKITGASFIVFSGALKSSTGMAAKMSVVEDGLLVQVTANTLNSLKSSLKDMNDFNIECGKKDAPTNEESVVIIWGEDDKQFNLGVRSCIDGLSLEGVNSIRMYSGTDFEGDKYLIRWVELFLIQNTELPRSSDGYDAGRAAEIIAQSFCPALVPCLESLIDSKINKIGLRVTLDPDKVGYDVGSNGSPLPSNYINRLDTALIPIIMGTIAPNMEVRLVIELLFYILVK